MDILNPLSWFSNPLGTAEDATKAWFQTPAVKIGLGVSLFMVAAGLIVWHRHSAEIRKLTVGVASGLPMAGFPFGFGG